MAFDGTIRDGTLDDRDFVLGAVPRLAAFGPPPWRPPDVIASGERRVLERFFAGETGDKALLIAETADGERLGFVFLEIQRDYFTREPQAHVGILVVAEAGEGRGVGGALLRASEAWARARRLTTITLNVFEKNVHAREVYEHLGYRADSLHYVKPLDDTRR